MKDEYKSAVDNYFVSFVYRIWLNVFFHNEVRCISLICPISDWMQTADTPLQIKA